MENKKITQGDVLRGIRFGTPKRVLYSEISQIAQGLPEERVIKGKAEEQLRDLAEEIHKTGK